MRDTRHHIDVVIPALNEEKGLQHVLADLPRDVVRRVVVADNGSSDGTVAVARAAQAEVVHEPRRGYGAACLRAIAHLKRDPPDIVVFLDADYSDYPEDLPALLGPITSGPFELVVGSRPRGGADPRALTLPQRVGNTVACVALSWIYRVSYTDLGPFRAIRWDTLQQLGMRDRDYGWTVEMQIRAARQGVRATEVPVRYRPRIGESKVSGTLRGVLGASSKIVWLLLRNAWAPRSP